MRVVILYGPDEECVDPRDPHQSPRSHFDQASEDVIVVWRTVRDPDSPDGDELWHFVGDGIFSEFVDEDIKPMLAAIGFPDVGQSSE